MTWGLVQSVINRVRGDIACPVRFHSRRSEATVGPVPITAPQSKPDGLQLAEARHMTQMQMLATQREIHGQTAAKMRDQRRSRQASICEAAMRRTTHAILAGGE
jgi:hypothetical protein